MGGQEARLLHDVQPCCTFERYKPPLASVDRFSRAASAGM